MCGWGKRDICTWQGMFQVPTADQEPNSGQEMVLSCNKKTSILNANGMCYVWPESCTEIMKLWQIELQLSKKESEM